MTLHGNLTWQEYNPEDIFEQTRRKNRIILMTFPECSEKLGLEPSILTVAPDGDNVEYSFKNRDFNDNDVNMYLCSVYISGMEEFEKWAMRHDQNKIVVGGYHPTTFPQEFTNLAWKIVQGPCDSLYKTLEQVGQIVPGIVTDKRIPRREIYDIYKNQQVIPDKRPEQTCVSINTSVGCSMKPPCDFCASPIMCSKVVSKPLELVEEELLNIRMYRPEFCFIRDENFFMQRDWERRLQMIGELLPTPKVKKPKLYLFASANTITEKKVQAMVEAGVYMVCLGLEDPTKDYQKNEKLTEACALLHEYGVFVYLSFIVNPLEIIGKEPATQFYAALNNRLKELRPEMICGNFLMPFPGTALWDKYYAYVDREDYKYYDSKTPFLVRNKKLQKKMSLFLIWHQWRYYTSRFYNRNVREFAVNDTLHNRFIELADQFKEGYETMWDVRT